MSAWDVAGYAMWVTFALGFGLTVAGIAMLVRGRAAKSGWKLVAAGVGLALASAVVFLSVFAACSEGTWTASPSSELDEAAPATFDVPTERPPCRRRPARVRLELQPIPPSVPEADSCGPCTSVRAVRSTALSVFVGVLALAGCGGGDTHYNASAVKTCLQRAGASVSEADADRIAADAGQRGYLVTIGSNRLNMAFERNSSDAADTENAYKAVSDGDTLQREGNVVMAWDKTPNSEEKEQIENCLGEGSGGSDRIDY
jgi:hypothetical protein